jgi:quercetin dioxygenase-like cupin family protein
MIPFAPIVLLGHRRRMNITTTLINDEVEFLGSRARVIADGAAIGGALGLVDMLEIPAGDCSPLHVHRDHEEGFYVLSGEVTLHLPGREITVAAGECCVAPRGVPHCYRVGDTPARALVFSTPAGFEVSPQSVAEAAAGHGIEILGPPGAMPSA